MLELSSPYTPSECIKLLRAAADPEWKLFGSKPVLGSVWGNRFWGYWRIFYGNSFRTFVFARFYPSGAGSRVAVRFGMSLFVRVFLGIWFGGLALIGGAAMIAVGLAYVRGDARPGSWIFIIVPSGMGAAGFALVRFGRWLGRNEQGRLTQFLRDTISAN